MKEHKNAEVLRAIADGVPLSEFEIRYLAGEWCVLDGHAEWVCKPEGWQIRRKPQHIMVNGFKVPKPLEVMPEDGASIYVPDFEQCNNVYAWYTEDQKMKFIKKGIAHSTEKAAIAHAKAMLGIDPEAA